MPCKFLYCNAYLTDSFKARVAASIGIKLEEMRGYGGEKPWPFASSEPLVILLAPNEPLTLKISPADCVRIADRLEQIARSWEHSPTQTENSHQSGRLSAQPQVHVPFLRDDHGACNLLEVCRGLRKAAELNKPMKFV
jgi:hypothetical protein